MGMIATLKRWFNMFFRNQAEKDFLIDIPEMPEMGTLISKCARIYSGIPEWANPSTGVKTINFAKALCSETARLAMLATTVTIDGSERAEWLQGQLDSVYYKIRHWIEYGCAYGTVFLKPNGKTIDVYTPNDILLVDFDNNNVNGIIFKDSYVGGKKYYTRLEYHRFVQAEDGTEPYVITNKAYVSRNSDDIGKPVPLEETRWADLMEETPPILKADGSKLDGALFGMFKTPQANNVDISSPLGLPIYAEAIEELRDLDVAYSRNATEIFDSEKIILADDRLLIPDGMSMKSHTADGMRRRMDEMKLPHYVKNVFGADAGTFYQEINPQLNTSVRLEGINALLSQIGYKVGFSNGYFVFNQSSGIQTATGVEAEQQRTIQFVKDVRDKVQEALDSLIYALNVMADLYDYAPVGQYEVNYDFGDITYNRDEDRNRWWSYVISGQIPAWYFFQKFEGLSEEDAKALIEQATPHTESLFGNEEE